MSGAVTAVQPLGAVMLGFASALMCATSTSPFTRPVGLAMVTAVPAVDAVALAEAPTVTVPVPPPPPPVTVTVLVCVDVLEPAAFDAVSVTV